MCLQSKTNLYEEYELGIIRWHREILVFIFSSKYKNSPGQWFLDHLVCLLKHCFLSPLLPLIQRIWKVWSRTPESLFLTRDQCSDVWTYFRKLYGRETLPVLVDHPPRYQWGCHDLQIVPHLGWEERSFCSLWDQERKVCLWVWVGGGLGALKNTYGAQYGEHINGPREEYEQLSWGSEWSQVKKGPLCSVKESGLHPVSKVVALKDFKQGNDKVRSTHLRNNAKWYFR